MFTAAMSLRVCGMWFQEPLKLLEVPLLCRSTEKPGMIDSNFPGSVWKRSS